MSMYRYDLGKANMDIPSGLHSREICPHTRLEDTKHTSSIALLA